jgi:NDP-sugar pyrophosphorylase family protein
MRAIILAGGQGTRLKPYTVVLPKPLMPICEFPILEIIIRQLVFNKFNHITLAVNHQAEIIKAYFQDGTRWGIKIDYSLEEKPLSTIGPLKLIKNLPDNFLIMNGDVLTDLNYNDFYFNHINSRNNFTISAFSRQNKIDYGVLTSDEDGNLVDFSEKPLNKYLVSMGVYMCSKSIVSLIPDNEKFGFDDLMSVLLREKKFPKIYKYFGYWLDIGRPDDYLRAIDEFPKIRQKFLNE